MGKTRIIEAVDLMGVTLAIFGFIFGAWSGVLSGLNILINLGKELSQNGFSTDNSSQIAIFLILSGISIFIICQIIALFIEIRTKSENWVIVGAALAFCVLILLVVLYFKYSARTSGILLTALGELLALITTSIMIYRQSRFRFLERDTAAEMLDENWNDKIVNAQKSSQSLSILSLSTSRFLTPTYIEMLEKELRSDDLVFPVKDGAYALIWKANPTVAHYVASHLQDLLQANEKIATQIGTSSYPEDGDKILRLIQQAEKALSQTDSSEEKSIMAISNSSLENQ